MIHYSNLPHHSIVCHVSFSMWLSLIVLWVFSIGNGPRRLANNRSCFSNPDGSILELLGSSNKSQLQFCTIHQYSCTICQYCSAPFVSTVLQPSSVQFRTIHQYSCTIRRYCSAPFISTVLHHSLVQFCTVHQSQFCTIRQFSSAPFVSYHSASCDYAILQFCIVEQSHYRSEYTLSNYLTALLKSKFLPLLPTEHFTLPVNVFILLWRFNFTN